MLAAYTKPLTADQVTHLLRRATFGPAPGQVKALTGQTAAQVVSTLLADQPAPPPPLDPTSSKTFTDQAYDQTNAGRYNGYLKYWWANLMLNQPVSLLEKMTLFWSNHLSPMIRRSTIIGLCTGITRCFGSTRWAILKPLP